jgi:hypothetical protein
VCALSANIRSSTCVTEWTLWFRVQRVHYCIMQMAVCGLWTTLRLNFPFQLLFYNLLWIRSRDDCVYFFWLSR